ncbi:phospholipase/carboxylesterase family protein [Cryptosporidium serpentis]
MKLHKGDGCGGEGLYYEPENYKEVIIWLHGLGGNANEWSDLIQRSILYPKLVKTKWILLSAPQRPVTLNNGMLSPAWFDIKSLNEGANEDIEGFKQSAVRIINIIRKEENKGIKQNKIIIGGFSQGAAMSYLVGLAAKNIHLGGIIALSGWLPLRNDGFNKGNESLLNDDYLYFGNTKENKNRIKIFVGHGEDDFIVQHTWGKNSANIIRDHLKLPLITFNSYSNMGHSINNSELLDVYNFMIDVFGNIPLSANNSDDTVLNIE